MDYSGGKRGIVLSIRPRKYKRLPQQDVMVQASKCCGIAKGITRKELIDRMRSCLPRFYELKKQGKTLLEINNMLKGNNYE